MRAQPVLGLTQRLAGAESAQGRGRGERERERLPAIGARRGRGGGEIAVPEHASAGQLDLGLQRGQLVLAGQRVRALEVGAGRREAALHGQPRGVVRGRVARSGAIAGALAAKKRIPVGEGTLPTHGPLFVVMLIGTVLLVGLLNYVPALALGPIVEHLSMVAAR